MASKKIWEKGLNPKQINFCKYYITEEFFCNWTKSYLKSYWGDEDTARKKASLLLTNVSVLSYIDWLLVDMWLNNQRVDKELTKLIIQDDEKNIKLGAIKEYNNLRARITKKSENTVNIISKEDEKILNDVLNNNLWI